MDKVGHEDRTGCRQRQKHRDGSFRRSYPTAPEHGPEGKRPDRIPLFLKRKRPHVPERRRGKERLEVRRARDHVLEVKHVGHRPEPVATNLAGNKRIIDQQCPSFTTYDIFGFVKTQATKMAY